MVELLFHKNFAPLNIVQFLGAFNDNVLRQVFLLLAVGAGAYDLQATATVVFAIPFLLFSAAAGQFADFFSKRQVVIVSRFAEFLVMVLAAVGIYLDSFFILLISLFLMALQSTFFSPAKYGILPEILPNRKLSAANGLIQMFTYAAILIGTATAGFLLQLTEGLEWIIGILLISSSTLSIFVSFLLEDLPAADPDQKINYNPIGRLASSLEWMCKDIYLILTMLGYAFGWFIGTVLTININVYGMTTMQLGEGWTSLFMVALGAGIGLGCLLAGYLSGERIEVGLVPFGAVGMGGCLLVLFTVPEVYWNTVGWMAVTGLFSGLFVIPLLATLQSRPPSEKKGEVLGTTNFFTFSGVALGAAGYVLMVQVWEFSAPGIMAMLGTLSLVVGLVAIISVPGYLLRFIFRALLNSFYRIEARGLENVPADAGALFVSNHVAYVDGFLISACFDRHVRFLAHEMFFKIPLIGWFLRLMKIIPICPTSPGKLKNSLNIAKKALDAGEYVCIFPEGAITRTGQILGINRGPEALAAGRDVPVIPIYLENVWGSIFSYEGGKFFWKLPKKLFSPVIVNFGEPIENDVNRQEIRIALQELEADTYRRKSSDNNPLSQYISKAGSFFSHLVLKYKNNRLSAASLLRKSLLIGRQFGKKTDLTTGRVGVITAPGPRQFLINLALALAGYTVCNIDYALSAEEKTKRFSSLNLEVLISTQQTDYEKTNFSNIEIIALEDLLADPGFIAKCSVWLQSLLPVFIGYDMDSDAAVFLSETNQTSSYSWQNLAAALVGLQKIVPSCGKKIYAQLSLADPVAYLGSFWWPLVTGKEIVYKSHHSPAKETVALSRSKENPGIAQLSFRALENRPDIELTGWWPEFAAGFVTLNVPDITGTEENTHEKGTKSGSVGRVVPGLVAKVVDVSADKQCEIGEEGKIMLKGPALAIEENDWFDTGHTGTIDSDGFIYIQDQA